MSDVPTRYAYSALDALGRKTRGVVEAGSERAAFESLKAQGLMPINVRAAGPTRQGPEPRASLRDRDIAELVADLAALLDAGSDIRTALTIIGGKGGRSAVQAAARAMAKEISGGDSLEAALGRQLGEHHRFVAALVAAGEANGDTVGGLQRGAEMLEARIRMRDQLVSVLAYPVFVMITAIVAFLIILTLVVPSLAPLAEAPGAQPGLAMGLLLGASRFLTGNGWLLTGGVALLVLLGVLAAMTGALGAWFDRLVLDGPTRKTATDLVYGGYAIALGGMLSSGAQVSEALRLSSRVVRSGLARRRLEPVATSVRQGEAVSAALARVDGFPDAIGRLALIGEESGALGLMLVRAGRLAEQAALRRVESIGRILGPAMIVALGGLIGLLMAGLLSGVTGLGDAALQ